MLRHPSSQQGFTLVELVAVIVLLGVIGAATTQFIRSSVGIYQDTARRDALTQMGRFAVERVSREVRTALPGSVRTRSQGGRQCLEFIPIQGVTSYLGRVSDAPPISTVDVIDFSYSHTSGDRAAIYTIDTNDVYAPGSSVITSIASVANGGANQQVLTLSSANRFPQESPQARLYVINQRVSFCATNGQLIRYEGYSSSGASQPVPPASGGVLLAEAIRLSNRSGNSVNVFEFLPGTLQRAGIVHLNFNFRDDVVVDEWVQFSQDVSIRNTP